VKNQITKSGTSIGANYYEANKARSKADFKNKIGICKSEANETIYWLEIINGDLCKTIKKSRCHSGLAGCVIIKNSLS